MLGVFSNTFPALNAGRGVGAMVDATKNACARGPRPTGALHGRTLIIWAFRAGRPAPQWAEVLARDTRAT